MHHVTLKKNFLLGLVASLLGMLPMAHVVQGQDRLVFEPESVLLIDGTSNHSDWTVTADSIYGWASVTLDDNGQPSISAAELHVLAKEIVSNKSPIMDRLMYRTLKTGEYSEIVFQLAQADMILMEDAGADSFSVSTMGSLSIAGVTNEVEVMVGAKRIGEGTYRFSGSHDMKMTDFGMKPPTALFGSLHTGDPVVVRFALVVNVD